MNRKASEVTPVKPSINALKFFKYYVAKEHLWDVTSAILLSFSQFRMGLAPQRNVWDTIQNLRWMQE